MRFFIVFLLFIIALPAHAEEADQITFCHVVANYQQPAGVEYQPGVDVHGKAVAPADVGGQPLRSFESIEIPVEVDLINRFNLNVPPGTQLNPYVALISIHKDGKVEYNGQDITQQAQDLCKDTKNEQAGPTRSQ